MIFSIVMIVIAVVLMAVGVILAYRERIRRQHSGGNSYSKFCTGDMSIRTLSFSSYCADRIYGSENDTRSDKRPACT